MVRVRGVGKAYSIYDKPQDRLKQMLLGRFSRRYGRDFWALRGVSFELARGETLGIIGRNGSGKSTLLQLIAGTLAPSEGEIEVSPHVAAFLELGSGFNPEFTGRENVLLNGAILGIPPEEMERRFGRIAEFADIGDFIEQPVRTYSSGMFLRLAFSVATAVDAEVLLIDEALAVGDVFFRQKCYRRLEALREAGTAILLVSHTMTDVEQFCRRAILLDRGGVLFLGPAAEAVKRYYLVEQSDPFDARSAPPPAALSEAAASPAAHGYWPDAEAFLDIDDAAQVSNGWARCTAIAVCDREGRPCRTFRQGETASFFYEFELLREIEVPIGGLVVHAETGVIVHGKNTLQYESPVPRRVACGQRLRFRHDIALEIAVGEYTFEVGLATMSGEDFALRDRFQHDELNARILRLCHLPGLGPFMILMMDKGRGQLLHHGLANLPGSCSLSLWPRAPEADG